ncbi:hypothetical protein HZS_1134 [Henneguya salminicola]|nr:hypothetical protein HZS_1134 [Henneguya salminicola]
MPIPHKISDTNEESSIIQHCCDNDIDKNHISLFSSNKEALHSLMENLSNKLNYIVSSLQNNTADKDMRALIQSKLRNIITELKFASSSGQLKQSNCVLILKIPTLSSEKGEKFPNYVNISSHYC